MKCTTMNQDTLSRILFHIKVLQAPIIGKFSNVDFNSSEGRLSFGNFNKRFHENDIALLEVEKIGGQFQSRPICLPSHVADSKLGQVCYVAGWGLVDKRGIFTKQLQLVDLPIVDINDCKQHYQYYSSRQVFTDGRNICAGYQNGFKDFCSGDSGGPLMCRSKNDCNWFIAGLGETYGSYDMDHISYGPYNHLTVK